MVEDLRRRAYGCKQKLFALDRALTFRAYRVTKLQGHRI